MKSATFGNIERLNKVCKPIILRKAIIPFFILSFLFLSNVKGQEYNSAMGIRVGNGVQWSGKIYLNADSALTGFLGVTNRGQGETRAGASMQWQKIKRLFDSDNMFFLYGAGLIGEFGDQDGFGIGPKLGISTDVRKKINIEADVFPTYYATGSLEFVLNFGVSVRFISKG